MKNLFKRLGVGSVVLLFAVAVYSNTITAQENPPTETQAETVVDKLEENEKTTEFAELLKVSGFADVLRQQGSFTVLAPSNEALQGKVDTEALKENQGKAQQIVQGHLFKGEISREQVKSKMGVEVEDSDESASNGTIYIVDQVVEQKPQQQQNRQE